MRKASIALGIIGGVLAIVIGLFALLGGVMMTQAVPDLVQEVAETDFSSDEYADSDFDYENMGEIEMATGIFTNLVVVYSVLTIIAGVLGLVGGLVVRKNNTVAGVLMILGCIVLLFTLHIIGFILLLLGGIFAFVKEKKETDNMAYDGVNFE